MLGGFPLCTCFWYAMYSGALACFKAVARAAMVWLCGPPCRPVESESATQGYETVEKILSWSQRIEKQAGPIESWRSQQCAYGKSSRTAKSSVSAIRQSGRENAGEFARMALLDGGEGSPGKTAKLILSSISYMIGSPFFVVPRWPCGTQGTGETQKQISIYHTNHAIH